MSAEGSIEWGNGIQGYNRKKGRENHSVLVSLKHNVESQFDFRRGTFSGERKVGPLELIFEIDPSLPSLLELADHGKPMDTVTVHLFKQDPEVGRDTEFATYTLTNARVASVTTELPEIYAGANGVGREFPTATVGLVAETIEYLDVETNSVHVFSWEVLA